MKGLISFIKKLPASILNRRWLFITILLLFGLVGFIAGFYKNISVSEILKPYISVIQNKTGVEIGYSHAELHFPFKIKFHEVEIKYRGKDLLKGDVGILKVSLFSLLFGGRKGTFTITGDGYLKIGFLDSRNNLKVSLKAKNYEYKSRYEHPYFSFNYEINLSGTASVVFDKKEIGKSVLNGSINVHKFLLKDLNVMNAVNLGNLSFNNILLKPTTLDGKFLIKDLRIKNNDVEGIVDISIVPSRELSLSRLDGKIEIKLSPSFFDNLRNASGFSLNKREIELTIRGPVRSPYLRWR